MRDREVTYGTVASAAGSSETRRSPREFCRKRTGGEESPPPRVNPPLAFPAATCKQLREHLQDGRGGDDMRRDRRLRNWAGVCRIIGLKGMGRPIVGLKGFLMQTGLILDGADTVTARAVQIRYDHDADAASPIDRLGIDLGFPRLVSYPPRAHRRVPRSRSTRHPAKRRRRRKRAGGRFSSGTARPNF